MHNKTEFTSKVGETTLIKLVEIKLLKINGFKSKSD